MITQDAYFTSSTLGAGENAITAHYLGTPFGNPRFSPPVLEVVNGSPALLAAELTTSVIRKSRKFLVRVTDATRAVLLSRKFPSKVHVQRQDVNGDGVLDIILQWHQNGKRRRLAFSGLDLTSLPTALAGL